MNVSHILTISKYQVILCDELDLWPVYSGEGFRESWTSSCRCQNKVTLKYNFQLGLRNHFLISLSHKIQGFVEAIFRMFYFSVFQAQK